MKKEFERYGLDKFRKMTGLLQLLGGCGLLVGLACQQILIISSGGLALLMFIGFGIRVKMKDGFLMSLPSFGFMVVNSWICMLAVKHLFP